MPAVAKFVEGPSAFGYVGIVYSCGRHRVGGYVSTCSLPYFLVKLRYLSNLIILIPMQTYHLDSIYHARSVATNKLLRTAYFH